MIESRGGVFLDTSHQDALFAFVYVARSHSAQKFVDTTRTLATLVIRSIQTCHRWLFKSGLLTENIAQSRHALLEELLPILHRRILLIVHAGFGTGLEKLGR